MLETGDFANAEPLLAEARAVSTDPRLAYNLGLCAFDGGRFGEAAAFFEEAALSADASLAQRAMFNQGNARYREGVELVEAASAPQDGEATAPAEAIESLQQALVPLRAALKHFRDAVRSDREDRDARANAELTHRTIREIERTIDELERQEQEQEQQQQQQDQQDGETSDQQQDESQDQSQQQQNQSGEQDQPQDQSQQQQDQSGEQSQPQDQSQQQQDQSGQQSQPQDQSQQQQGQSGE
ncbi:MAG: hypothetical protein ACO4BU_08805, partial [Phycisphaerales bacterium]